MATKTWWKLVLISWLGLWQAVWAQTAPACTGAYRIAFFNGINTSFLDAGESILRLRDEFGDTFNGQPMLYLRFYNPSDGVLNDLAEAFTQAEKEHPELTGRWEEISARVNGGSKYDGLFSPLDPTSDTVKDLVNRFGEVIAKSPANAVNDAFVAKFNQLMDNREKIVAVAHSQGNWFMNYVAQQVRDRQIAGQESTAYVHVATFTTQLSGPYTNSASDQALVRGMAILPGVQEPNVDSGFLLSDWLAHGFISVYMNRALAAMGQPYPQVRRHILEALNKVKEYPCMSIVPPDTKVVRNSTVALMAHSTAPDGSPLVLPPGLVWASSAPDIASVTQDGLVSGLQVGVATVKVTDPLTKAIAIASVTVVPSAALPVRPLWEFIGPMNAVGACRADSDGVTLLPQPYHFTQAGYAYIELVSACRYPDASSYQYVPGTGSGLNFTYSTLNPPSRLAVVNYPGAIPQVGYSLAFTASSLGRLVDTQLMHQRVFEYLTPFVGRTCLLQVGPNGIGYGRVNLVGNELRLNTSTAVYSLNVAATVASQNGYKEFLFADTNELSVHTPNSGATPELFVSIHPFERVSPDYPYLGGEIAIRTFYDGGAVQPLRCRISEHDY